MQVGNRVSVFTANCRDYKQYNGQIGQVVQIQPFIRFKRHDSFPDTAVVKMADGRQIQLTVNLLTLASVGGG